MDSSFAQEGQPIDPVTATLEHLVASMARMEVRMDEFDRRMVPPRREPDPLYGIPNHWFTDPLPQSLPGTNPTHTVAIPTPRPTGFGPTGMPIHSAPITTLPTVTVPLVGPQNLNIFNTIDDSSELIAIFCVLETKCYWKWLKKRSVRKMMLPWKK